MVAVSKELPPKAAGVRTRRMDPSLTLGNQVIQHVGDSDAQQRGGLPLVGEGSIRAMVVMLTMRL